MARVLVLDQSYLPINIVSWKQAIIYLMQEKVEVIKEYEDVFVRSAHNTWKIPAVIRFIAKFICPRKMIKFNRQNVYARDRWKCQYCDKKFGLSELTYDHVLPKSRGGKTDWENIVTSCIPCNVKKGDKTPQEAKMKLYRVPTKPDWMPIFIVKANNMNFPEDWKDYIYMR